MGERYRQTGLLVRHFFRRFFDNDTVQIDGDTQTTVVRAISVVAAPGLLITFFLQNQYWRSPPWVMIQDHYFFVLFSFVVMGAISIFEWEMLFPDRLDFLVLSPLPLKPLQMLSAKAAALGGFLALFLIACNLFGTILLPMLINNGDFFRQIYAHGVAVLLAGVFVASLIVALGGVLRCILDAVTFRMVSPVAQMLSIMVLALLMLHYVKCSDSLQALLSEPLGMARCIPPLWFLGLYEKLLHGNAAPPFAGEMARLAVRGTAMAMLVVLITYPIAWMRMRKMTLEGSSRRRGAPSRWLTQVLHSVVRHPQERAVFHFIGQTIARNNRYQVYLAIYCGAGLALAIACATTLRANGMSIEPKVSDDGLHAVMPLLLFWVIAGLRTAFAFPINMPARWIFNIPGVTARQSSAAARRWALLCAMFATCSIVAALGGLGWDVRHLLVQAVFGLCLSVLLIDGFFVNQRVPFTRPRMPGRTSFPLMLTLYVGVFPIFVFGVTRTELIMEKNLAELLYLGFAVTVVHATLKVLRMGPDEIEEEMEGYEGEFQLLGLS